MTSPLLSTLSPEPGLGTPCVQIMELPEASKEQLQDAWKAWMQEAGGWSKTQAGGIMHLQGGAAFRHLLYELLCVSSCCRTLRMKAQQLQLTQKRRSACTTCLLRLQWRRRAPSRPATRLARPCGSSASKRQGCGSTMQQIVHKAAAAVNLRPARAAPSCIAAGRQQR